MSESPSVPDQPCPLCGERKWHVEWRLVATGGSLAGVQPKVSAREWPHLVCDSCGGEVAAKKA